MLKYVKPNSLGSLERKSDLTNEFKVLRVLLFQYNIQLSTNYAGPLTGTFFNTPSYWAHFHEFSFLDGHSLRRWVFIIYYESVPKLEIASLNFRIPNDKLSFRPWKWFWDFYECENKMGFGMGSMYILDGPSLSNWCFKTPERQQFL